jgi:hypothetical protein
MAAKLQQKCVVTENGKLAVIKDSEVWGCCVFNTIDEAVHYAQIWCGRMIEGRPAYILKDWIEGINISQTKDECIVTISNILVP